MDRRVCKIGRRISICHSWWDFAAIQVLVETDSRSSISKIHAQSIVLDWQLIQHFLETPVPEMPPKPVPSKSHDKRGCISLSDAKPTWLRKVQLSYVFEFRALDA